MTLNNRANTRSMFPFVHKRNTLNGDRIVVPVGWGS